MTTMRFLGGAIFLFTMSGCSYHTDVNVAPAYNVYSSYEEPIPGRWALHVDSQGLGARVVDVDGWICHAHEFPMDITLPFRKSVTETMSTLVEEIELVDSPFAMDALSRGGHSGQIVIRTDSFDPKVWFGFRASAEVELEVSVIVDGLENRLLESTVSSEGDAEESAGAFCGGGAHALANATEEAIEEVLERLGERISNSRRIREYMDNIDLEAPHSVPERDLRHDARFGVGELMATYNRE